MSVLVTSRSFGSGTFDPTAMLEAGGLSVVRGDINHDLEALREPLADAVAWIAGVAPITDAHLERAPRLKLIARFGVGFDAIDLNACQRRGVIVTNTPGGNTQAVADQALALMLVALRRVTDGVNAVRAGGWPALRGRELGALTVGLVGFGQIGRAVAKRLSGFGARVIAFDPFVPADAMRAAGVEAVHELEVLLEQSDVISLHLPGGKVVMDAATLERVRPGAILINTARGDLLDEQAVANALESGRLGAVAVDVLNDESNLSSPLVHAKNALVTPHNGAQTLEAIDRVGRMATEEVLRVLNGETPLHRVI